VIIVGVVPVLSFCPVRRSSWSDYVGRHGGSTIPGGYQNPAAETRSGRKFRTIIKLNLIGHATPVGITFAFAVFSCALPSVYRVLFLKPQPVVIARDLARR
jgi:hypothetical protein